MYACNKPQLKPRVRARAVSGEPPVTCRHVVSPYTYTFAGSARPPAGVGSLRWVFGDVRWQAAPARLSLCFNSASLSEICTCHCAWVTPHLILTTVLPSTTHYCHCPWGSSREDGGGDEGYLLRFLNKSFRCQAVFVLREHSSCVWVYCVCC